MSIGTCDFFFDTCDKLQELGTEFLVVVKHPSGDGVMVLSNVKRAGLAGHMLRAAEKTFDGRFSPNQDQSPEDSDEPSI